MKVRISSLKIVFQDLQSLWGALLGLSELHFGSQEAPRKLSGSSLGALSGSLGAHNLLTGSMDRDFGALRELLGALLTASLRPRGLQSSQIWSSELSGVYFYLILCSQHIILSFKG